MLHYQCLWFLLLFFLETAISQLQFIKPFAGTGTLTYNGDNLPPTSTNFYYPTCMFPDSVGNFYVCDTNNHLIRKISTATNIVTTIAGVGSKGLFGDDGSATQAALNTPYSVWVSTSGVVYIADTNNHRVRMVSVSGIISTVAGSPDVKGGSYTGFVDGAPALSSYIYGAKCLTVDSMGNIYFGEGTTTVKKNHHEWDYFYICRKSYKWFIFGNR